MDFVAFLALAGLLMVLAGITLFWSREGQTNSPRLHSLGAWLGAMGIWMYLVAILDLLTAILERLDRLPVS